MLDKQTDNKNCALVIPPFLFSQGAACCFSVSSYVIIYLYRAVQGTSFADGCIRVQHRNLQVHVEAKNLTVRKEATMFKTVCTTMTPDTVKLFSGNVTGKRLFGVARCDNAL
jgi:hypothetical protein